MGATIRRDCKKELDELFDAYEEAEIEHTKTSVKTCKGIVSFISDQHGNVRIVISGR